MITVWCTYDDYNDLMMIFDKILTKFDQIFTIYIKKFQIHVQNFQGRHFPRTKKAPAGMPTHRTGVDNIKNSLKLIKIN